MIEIKNVTKRFKDKVVVDDLSVCIQPGVVTGLLGPNGAGKSTTLRMILNLTIPTQGEVTIHGKRYEDLKRPVSEIGAFIDSEAFFPRFTAYQHLKCIATASGISLDRARMVLQKTGLEKVKDKQIAEFSLGMKQRLGIAAALLGDPKIIILDEPFNALDVDGISWLRELIKDLARKGKAVLVSSHLMSEVQMIADRVIVMAQGKLIADMTIEELSEKSSNGYVKVRSENNRALKNLLEKEGALIQEAGGDELQLRKMEMEQVGIIAKKHHIAIFELQKIAPSLEELFIELTAGQADYVSRGRGDGRNGTHIQ